jgi:uncharacterized protein (TIGR03083 family)
MDYSAKDLVLDVVKTERAKFYSVMDVPANWENPTRSGHWQVRDLAGHMIDVSEGYLKAWDLARRQEQPPAALGLPVMGETLDRIALTYRNLPREEVISRLKSSSDRLMTIFDGLTAEQWGSFNISHTYMGPLPMFFYPAFQIMDYGVHGWDMRAANDRTLPMDERAAGVLVPYMFVLMQYTVDAESAKGVDATYGIIVDGQWGGQWKVTVKDGQFAYEPTTDAASLPAVFHFHSASDFVLNTFQREEKGDTSGDPTIITQVRKLFFRI